MQAPQAAQRPRGLLGGFFGPEGRDARSRFAIGLEGLAMNPNQALIGQLEQKIKELETAKREATSTMEIHNVTLEIATLPVPEDLDPHNKEAQA